MQDSGYEAPRPIQRLALPAALEGRDVLGLAQTGTGKTAAFVLPILQRLLDHRGRGVRALVLTPTRELCSQVHEEFQRLAHHTRLSAVSIFGGVPVPRQVRAVRRNPDIVVACPGRLLDLMSRGVLDLGRVEVLVLDEADHMFDMGFLPDVRRILRALPRERQNLLFSATMAREIRRLADDVLHSPEVVELAHSKPADTIEHGIFCLAEGDKMVGLERLLRGEEFRSGIVFLRTKQRAKRLAKRLDERGHNAVAMQGNMSQGQRERALEGFRRGRYDVLVATDIAARGLDISGVSHVVNYDVPGTPDAYTHRIGRTGRSENQGTAYTFVTPADGKALRAIEKHLGGRIERRSSRELGLSDTQDPAPELAGKPAKGARERGAGERAQRSRTAGRRRGGSARRAAEASPWERAAQERREVGDERGGGRQERRRASRARRKSAEPSAGSGRGSERPAFGAGLEGTAPRRSSSPARRRRRSRR